jgi:small-conductance mechanosensitive channel
MRFPTALALVLLALSTAVFARGDGASAAAAPEGVEHPAATLRVFNREVFVFRAAQPGLTPEARLRRANDQIRWHLEQPGPALEVSIAPDGQDRAVLLDGELVFRVLADDASGNAAALDTVALRAAEALRRALSERREAGDLRALAFAALQTVIGLALLLPLLWLLRHGYRRLHRALAARAVRHVGRLQLEGVSLVSGDHLLGALRVTSRVLYVTIWLALVFEWLSFSLQRFPYTRPLGEDLQDILLGSLALVGGGVVAALPSLMVAVLIFALAHFLLSSVRPFFDRVEQGGIDLGWLDADTVRPTRRLVSAAVWIFALAMAYPYLPGAQTEAFKGLSVLVGLMISLGASSLVGQAASGLILMYTRTLRAGEFVRVGEHEGTVVEMGTFATRIRTGLGEELTLPNTLIASGVTKNYSRAVTGDGFVLDTTVTIGYDTPWRQVEAMLMLAAARTPGVLADPGPRVFQTALADFYVEYRLVVQARPTEPGPRAQVLNRLHGHIQDVFNEFGVQIMSPHYLGDPAAAKTVPASQWHAAPAPASAVPREPVTS